MNRRVQVVGAAYVALGALFLIGFAVNSSPLRMIAYLPFVGAIIAGGIGCIQHRFYGYELLSAAAIVLGAWLFLGISWLAFLMLETILAPSSDRFALVYTLLGLFLNAVLMGFLLATCRWDALRRACGVLPVDLCTSIAKAIQRGKVEFARDLISRGDCGFNRVHGLSPTPLMAAVRGGHHDLINLLLTAGADPHRKSLVPFCRPRSPIEQAICQSDVQSLRLLERRDASETVVAAT